MNYCTSDTGATNAVRARCATDSPINSLMRYVETLGPKAAAIIRAHTAQEKYQKPTKALSFFCTPEERETIAALAKQGRTVGQIANETGRSRECIKRMLAGRTKAVKNRK